MSENMSENIDTEYIQILKNVFLSKLINLDIIKKGRFTLKNGTTSNIYMDFRKLINYPNLFSYLDKLIGLMFPKLLDGNNIKLMPIPMGGLPLGNYLSFSRKIPQIMVRDKPKNHGTKNLIEGDINDSDKFIIVEDVITSGTSIRETLDNITKYYGTEFLKYHSIICICNRGIEQSINGININSIFTLEEIEKFKYGLYSVYLENVKFFKYGSIFSNELYSRALEKKSNIILSCDFMDSTTILNIIKQIGHLIVGVKLHLDTLKIDNINEFVYQLDNLQLEKQFIIIEDAKFADIEAIMIEKVKNLESLKLVNAITIHGVAGLSVLNKGKLSLPSIIVGEMSCDNNMITDTYSRNIINYIRENGNNLTLGGLVVQSKIPQILDTFEVLTMSPGISISMTNDNANQKYSYPDIKSNKLGLFWIVGRGITNYYKDTHQNNLNIDDNIIKITEKYNQLGWEYFINY